jgi:hypothetical protein
MQKCSQIKQKEFTFQAGEMLIENGKAKANPDSGIIRFYIGRDQMLFFEWKNITKNLSSEPLVILGGEWVWKKIQTQKGRLFMLQSVSYPEEKFLYYMQYPNKSEDQMNENLVNNILKTGTLELNEDKPQENEEMSVEGIVKAEKEKVEAVNTNTGNINQVNPSPNNNAGSSDFIKNFANSVKMIKGKD